MINNTTAVKYPFRIAGGSVLMTTNPSEIIGSMVTFCLGAHVGERVMRPDWGIDILDSVFSMGGSVEAGIRDAIDQAFRKWFPEFQVRAVEIDRTHPNPAYVEVTVRYGRYDTDMDEAVRVGTEVPDGALSIG